MTLTPKDMLEIQYALDRYEKRFPRKPSPSVEEALAWQAGKHRQELRTIERSPKGSGECGALSWAWQSLLVWLQVRR